MNCVCTANGNTIFNNEDVINIHFETVTFQNTNKVDFIANYFSPFVFHIRTNETFVIMYLQDGGSEGSHAVNDNNFCFYKSKKSFYFSWK